MPNIILENSISVVLPSGFRLIRKDDINKSFKSEDKRMRDYKLPYFYSWNSQSNNTVIVKEAGNGLIDGVIMFRFSPSINKPEKIIIEMLARNFSSNHSNSGVGSELVHVVENNIARQMHIGTVIIEAVKDLENYYASLGYHSSGSEYFDSSWKKVIYMVKNLN
ncbi:MAG: GNAT family N-acetyltransferase [Ferroplasma sp.]